MGESGDLIVRFVIYNLGGSIVAGLISAAIVLGVAWLLRVRSAEARTYFLALPLIKSTLVLLGLSRIAIIPTEFWRDIRAQTVPFEIAGPPVLAWIALSAGAYLLLRWRANRDALASGRPAHADSPAEAALTSVMSGMQDRGRLSERVRCLCPAPERVPRPQIVLSEHATSPAIISGNSPTMVLPAGLEQSLDRDELQAVIAHEVAHVALGRPRWIATNTCMRLVSWTSPISVLIRGLLQREEELACDEIAAEVTQRPEALASALLKTYRVQAGARHGVPAMAARLLGSERLLERRVRRLIADETAGRESTGPLSLVAGAIAGALVFTTL